MAISWVFKKNLMYMSMSTIYMYIYLSREKKGKQERKEEKGLYTGLEHKQCLYVYGYFDLSSQI